MIIGVHPDSHKLFSHKLNINLTSQGFIDCLIKSEGGLFPMRHFFKSAIQNIKKPTFETDISIGSKIVELFLELCEKAKNDLVNEDQTKTTLIMD